MEGGNKVNINLESPLDVTSSDMLVPVNQPTFQHNWQKFQGKCLPNSLRFEKNGWAAGWNVIDFAYSLNRVEVDGMYTSALKLNNNPTYSVGLYETADSEKVVCEKKVTPINKRLTENINITGDVIVGELSNGKAFRVTWDPLTEQASIDNPDVFDLKSYTQNANYTWSFNIEDKIEKYSVDNNLYMSEALSGKGLVNPVNYTSFENGVHNWSSIAFDGTYVTMPDITGDITPTSISGNTIQFNASQTRNEELGITYTIDKYFEAFNRCNAIQSTGDYMTVATDALSTKKFNYYKVELHNKNLSLDNSVLIDVRVPVWITIGLKIEFDEYEGIKWPTNTRAIEFNAPANKFTVTLCSVFDGKDHSSSYSTSKGSRCILGTFSYRYASIMCSNTIAPVDGFNTKRFSINSECWLAGTRRFNNIRQWENMVISYGSIGSITYKKMVQYIFGDFDGCPHTWGSPVTDIGGILEYNNWANWNDENNAVYTKKDISRILSVIHADDPYTTDEYPASYSSEHEYWLAEADIDDAHRVDRLLKFGTGNISSYQEDDPYIDFEDAFEFIDTGIDDDYDDDSYDYKIGRYKHNTYYRQPCVFSTDYSCWPFSYIPRCNVRFENRNYKGVYGCYERYGSIELITDLNKFKALVMGEYDTSYTPNNDPLPENQSYNTKRKVTTYKSVFDFDWADINSTEEKRAAWDEKWNDWYPGIENPADLKVELSSDDTYLDYENIEMLKDQTFNINIKAKPGIFLCSSPLDDHTALYDMNYYVECFNKYDIKPWKNAPETTGSIFENHEEVSSNYELTKQFANTSIKVEYNEETGEYRDSGSVYGYFGETSILNDVIIRSKQAIIYPTSWGDQYPSWSYVKSKIESGRIAFFGKCKTYESGDEYPGIVKEFGISYTEGQYNNYADQYDNNGKKIKRWKYTPAENLERISPVSITYDNTDGLILAQPFWGHLCYELDYKKYGSEVDFSSDRDSVIELKQLKNVSSILTDNKKYILVDRTTSESYPLSREWFSLEIVNVAPTEKAQFRLKPVSDGQLYYSVKKTGSDGKEVDYNYCYPTTVGYNGNMKSISSNICMFDIKWAADAFYIPSSMTFEFNPSITDTLHQFYAKAGQLFGSIITAIAGPSTRVNDRINIDLKFDDTRYVRLSFDTKKQTTYIPSTQTIALSEYNTSVKFEESSIGTGKNIKLPMKVTYSYTNITGKFAQVSSDVLEKWESDKFTCSQGSNIYTYSTQSKRLVGNNVQVTVTEITGGENIKFTSSAGTINFSAVLRNIINNEIVLDYDSHAYTVDASELFSKDNSVIVKSTDIRKPDKTIHIGKLDVNNYQFVKQAWNTTVEVENFWWVDDDHILELTNEKFILKRKSDKLSDWDGDEFIPVTETLRSSILDEHTTVYFVTNTYKCDNDGLFITLQASDDTVIIAKVYDIRQGFKLLAELNLKVRRRDIGQKLNDMSMSGNTTYFNTYNYITAKQLLSQAKWTNTVTDNKLFIGCHLSNNYDQWTAIYSLSSFSCINCIQGYGFVGLKGDLTGGMIPKEYFSINEGGFNSVVQDMSVLNKEEDASDADAAYKVSNINDINKIEKRVIGNSEKQWYIQKELYGVVSHIRYVQGGQFIIEELPITNRFDAVYKSPSFHIYAVGDAMVQATPFEGLFNFNGTAGTVWSIICKACGYPLLYSYSPRISTLAYLQQTLGQYAYVHYNSSETDEPDNLKSTAGNNGLTDNAKTMFPILSDELTFDKQIVEQSALNTAPFDKFITLLFGMFAPALAHLDRNLVVNGEVNQTAVLDTGKKYSQFVMENLANLGTKALLTESNEQAITSKVTGIKSLDMFYSTSDKQRIFAGPGYVEHQLVANCVAQSVTDCAAEGQVRQLTLILKSLTAFQGMLVCKLEELAAKGLYASADMIKEAMVCANNVGAYVAAGMTAAAVAIEVAQAATEMAYAALDKVIDVMAQRGVTCEDTGRISRYSLSLEAKHKYGEKNEVFMWPCMGVPESGLSYKDETVEACVKKSVWQVNLQASKCYIQDYFIQQVTQHFDDLYTGDNIAFSSAAPGEKKNRSTFNNYGDIDYYTASCVGSSVDRALPADMACVQGVESFLPPQPFKNENIGCSNPAFAPSMFQDYVIDKSWDLTQCCTYGRQLWVTVKDTKITNCAPSNMRVNDEFCGIATSYSAIEVKRGLTKSYMRPWAITPNVLALNCSGYNAILDNKLYHAFDGISYRLVEWKGSPAMGKNFQTRLYGFQVNDRFKRSNKFPANEALGNFSAEPVQYVDSIDKFWTEVTVAAKQKGLEGGTIGEDKDATRWALPVFTEPVTTLPAAVKTLTAMPLNVFDGVTGLTTNLMNNQTAYKAPLSVDFTIGKSVFRQTEEYICAVQTDKGLDILTDIVPSLGLKYIGSTPSEAYFYSKATRCYYLFTGSNLVKMDMMERFRDIQKGYWDFVNQEVVMPCLMTFKRLNPEVLDTDTATDNIIVPLMSRGQVVGELPPPITTVFNDRSWYKCVSLPSGFAYQGPNRVIINRNVFVEYMLESLKNNLGKWSKVDRENYIKRRTYPEQYNEITESIDGVEGWTYNPFLLVTSPFGMDEDTDCMFEWIITFCWPIEMDLIYGTDNYACVNIMAETMTPGGKQKSRPTHVFLTKELFTRNGNYGYYSFRFQSKNGVGNRERLSIWSDQYIAVSSITCEVKPVTQRRTEQLTQQQDVLNLKEL